MRLTYAQWIVAGCVIALLVYGMYSFLTTPEEVLVPEIEVVAEIAPPAPDEPAYTTRVFGYSVEGRVLEAHTYGDGATSLLVVGGIHGGYEWNSVLLAYELMDHLRDNPTVIPENVTVTIVPSANPDGVYRVIEKEGRFTLAEVPEDEGPSGTGRFNANDVDLNRNFDCKWQPESTWREDTVSAGSEVFSEPEATALRDLVLELQPTAAVFLHSQSNAVYASECEEGILPQTYSIMNTYADAAGYPTVDSFDHYTITGDAEGWLASIGIPAITVELSTHETTEWEKNKAGMHALLDHLAEDTLLAQ